LLWRQYFGLSKVWHGLYRRLTRIETRARTNSAYHGRHLRISLSLSLLLPPLSLYISLFNLCVFSSYFITRCSIHPIVLWIKRVMCGLVCEQTGRSWSQSGISRDLPTTTSLEEAQLNDRDCGSVHPSVPRTLEPQSTWRLQWSGLLKPGVFPLFRLHTHTPCLNIHSFSLPFLGSMDSRSILIVELTSWLPLLSTPTLVSSQEPSARMSWRVGFSPLC